MSLTTITIALLGVCTFGTGFVFALQTDLALRFQRRYAEAASSVPPSENPEFYDATEDHRTAVFRIGGTVLLVVGTGLLAVATYAAFFASTPP
jgi:hypothetical protein